MMKIETITTNLPFHVADKVAFILSRTGQICTVTGRRAMKTRAAYKSQTLEKESTFQVRVGVTFDNVANTKAKRESGELPAVNTGLPVWAEEVRDDNGKAAKGLIRNVKSGILYLRGKPNAENPQAVKAARFLLNGKEVSKERAMEIAPASEFKPSNGDWIYYKLENITSIK